jgi:transposase
VTYSVRVVRNGSAQSVQVVTYREAKRLVAKHIGTAQNALQLSALKTEAARWINENEPQRSLFETAPPKMLVEDCEYQESRMTFVYELLTDIYRHFRFDQLKSRLLADLAIMRIVEPCSKKRSLELLETLFGIHYANSTLYRLLARVPSLKNDATTRMVAIATAEFGFDFTFVLYDVTTLYFESFESDELRKPGFSKDNKAAQPQIVIGLMVTKEGLPVSYEIHKGNTFEGSTFLPAIRAFKRQHKRATITVVADAAMLSEKNMEELRKEGLTYVVGARLHNISDVLCEKVTTIARTNGATLRTETDLGTLIVAYSDNRFRKDRHEMEKHMTRANVAIERGIRTSIKYVGTTGEERFLKKTLIEKDRALLGLKGYYTNTLLEDAEVIAHYQSLFQVEASFRIAKSDLATRPIFHRKEMTIASHILICVMALAIARYMELKTGKSIKALLTILKRVTTAHLIHTLTGRRFTMPARRTEEVIHIRKQIFDRT